ncbi:UNVERIFIED_ORG: hypothetical protein LA328_07475 [Hafnia paralvei]|nr:hypothetical protein [Hafnia paralvei]
MIKSQHLDILKNDAIKIVAGFSLCWFAYMWGGESTLANMLGTIIDDNNLFICIISALYIFSVLIEFTVAFWAINISKEMVNRLRNLRAPLLQSALGITGACIYLCYLFYDVGLMGKSAHLFFYSVVFVIMYAFLQFFPEHAKREFSMIRIEKKMAAAR